MVDNKVVDVSELLEISHIKSDDDLKLLISRATWQFTGDIDDLYAAVGCLVVGRLFGWRILRLTLTSKKYAKYQRILALGLDKPGEFRFNEWMREEERLSYKSIGLRLVKLAGDFWAAAKGCLPDLPLSKRRDVGA